MKKINLLLIALVALSFHNQAQTVSDKDGNTYGTVTIGTQVWMTENLKTTKYNDNSTIALVTDNTVWSTLTTGAYCFYNNDESYKSTYGVLYNWYTISSDNLCPTGWHVPSSVEWLALNNYLGGMSVANDMLKEAGTTHWSSPSTGTNSTGFTGLPAGSRDSTGSFYDIFKYGYFWSSTADNLGNGWGWDLAYSCDFQSYGYIGQNTGLSVRCMQNSVVSNVEKIEDANALKIFPNPASDIITINCTKTINEILIYNLFGQLVNKQQVNNNINRFDVSNLPNGIYVIEVEDAQGAMMQQKLIKN
jgi:uncharacterized protein (TIGR02145 family)